MSTISNTFGDLGGFEEFFDADDYFGNFIVAIYYFWVRHQAGEAAS
jgi:hypothetical protein